MIVFFYVLKLYEFASIFSRFKQEKYPLRPPPLAILSGYSLTIILLASYRRPLSSIVFSMVCTRILYCWLMDYVWVGWNHRYISLDELQYTCTLWTQIQRFCRPSGSASEIYVDPNRVHFLLKCPNPDHYCLRGWEPQIYKHSLVAVHLYPDPLIFFVPITGSGPRPKKRPHLEPCM